MLRFFVNDALPSILLMVTVAASLGFYCYRRLRALNAAELRQQRRRSALQDSRDALAAVIAEGLISDEVRETKVLPAYQELCDVLAKPGITP